MAATVAALTFVYGLGAVLLTHHLAERMRANPLIGRWLEKLADAPQLKITQMRAVGDDWRVTAIPVPAASV